MLEALPSVASIQAMTAAPAAPATPTTPAAAARQAEAFPRLTPAQIARIEPRGRHLTRLNGAVPPTGLDAGEVRCSVTRGSPSQEYSSSCRDGSTASGRRAGWPRTGRPSAKG